MLIFGYQCFGNLFGSKKLSCGDQKFSKDSSNDKGSLVHMYFALLESLNNKKKIIKLNTYSH